MSTCLVKTESDSQQDISVLFGLVSKMTFSDIRRVHNWEALTGTAVTSTEASLSPFRCLNLFWQSHSQTGLQGFSPNHCGQMTKTLFLSPNCTAPCSSSFRKADDCGAGSLRERGGDSESCDISPLLKNPPAIFSLSFCYRRFVPSLPHALK